MQSYVPSRYNHFFKDGDKYLGVSLLTDAVISLDEDQYKLVRELLELTKIPRGRSQRAMYQLLIDSMFLLPSGFDEAEYLKPIFDKSTACRKGFSLGLVLTLGCNFRCVYCYQEHKSVRMERDVQRSVLALLEDRLPGKEAFEVAWWGGEPLLETEIIDRFGGEMIQLCDSLQIRYSSSVTTNGYLLNEDNIRLLEKGLVKRVQVTLDGPREFHNRRRFLADGGGTYDVILDNLYRLVQMLPDVGITIRANISRGTLSLEQWQRFLADLSPVRDSIELFFAPVVPAGSFDSLCISHEEFHTFHKGVMSMIEQQGFKTTFGLRAPGVAFCGAMPVDNWMVTPRGYLSKCTAHVDGEEGTLARLNPDGSIELNSDADKWLSFSPFKLRECKQCDVLPLCMGGCLKVAFDDPFVDRCYLNNSLLAFIKGRVMRAERR